MKIFLIISIMILLNFSCGKKNDPIYKSSKNINKLYTKQNL